MSNKHNITKGEIVILIVVSILAIGSLVVTQYLK